MSLFKKEGKVERRCVKSPDGKLVCKATRENSDGTKEEIAGVEVHIDASCNLSTDEEFETEEGELQKLEQKFLSRIKTKCKNRPADF